MKNRGYLPRLLSLLLPLSDFDDTLSLLPSEDDLLLPEDLSEELSDLSPELPPLSWPPEPPDDPPEPPELPPPEDGGFLSGLLFGSLFEGLWTGPRIRVPFEPAALLPDGWETASCALPEPVGASPGAVAVDGVGFGEGFGFATGCVDTDVDFETGLEREVETGAAAACVTGACVATAT